LKTIKLIFLIEHHLFFTASPTIPNPFCRYKPSFPLLIQTSNQVTKHHIKNTTAILHDIPPQPHPPPIRQHVLPSRRTNVTSLWLPTRHRRSRMFLGRRTPVPQKLHGSTGSSRCSSGIHWRQHFPPVLSRRMLRLDGPRGGAADCV